MKKEKRIYKIYKITNKINHKIYIGKTINTLHHRFKQHINGALRKEPRFKRIRLYQAIRKYGADNFEITLLDKALTEDEINVKEKEWIKKLDSRNPDVGYNMMIGGEGGCTSEAAKRGCETKRKNGTLQHTEETKRKISEAHKGIKFSTSHKQHLSDHHRLKTTHVLLYKDGHTETTQESLSKIASSFDISASILRNYSKRGDPHFLSFYLLDLEDFDESFSHLFIKTGDKVYWDPIKKESITFESLVAYKKHNPTLYKEIIPHKCLIESKQKEKELYIKNQLNILNKALLG